MDSPDTVTERTGRIEVGGQRKFKVRFSEEKKNITRK